MILSGPVERSISRSILICLAVICSINAVGGWLSIVWGRELLRMIKPDALVVEQAMVRLRITMSAYFILGAMDTFSGGLRGMGRSISPLVVTFLGACVYRIVWIGTVFPRYRSLGSLLVTYPVSWTFIATVNGTMFFLIVRRLIARGEYRTVGRRA